MGILRTDKISGLETPTAVTGSVVFDGNGDRLSVSTSSDLDLTEDLTLELWIYINSTPNNYITFFNTSSNGTYTSETSVFWGKSEKYFALNVSGTTLLTVSTPSDPTNTWYHIAVTRSGSTTRLFLNGQEADSSTTSWSAITGQTWYIGDRPSGAVSANYPLDGYISNLRVLKGTALYTSNFTPPTHELEVIGDTSLLCCNNPDSAGAEGTGKTITVSGDAAASTFSPGLTRDFTYGTEFKGVTTFDTQGYFVPPSGTTEQRGRGRAVFGGGDSTGQPYNTSIEYFQLQTSGMSFDFGDLTLGRNQVRAVSSSTRGVFGGGRIAPASAQTNTIDYVTIATTSNAVDFGDLSVARGATAPASNSTRGVFMAGYDPANTNHIDYITIASLGNATDFGDTLTSTHAAAGCASPTRGIMAGGFPGINTIEYITIASTGNSVDFGDRVQAQHSVAGCSSQTRGIFGGGTTPGTGNIIDYITISTTGNAQDFGDLVTASTGTKSATSNQINGCFFAGWTGSAYVTDVQKVIIASTGNAVNFGSLMLGRHQTGATSDSHGGIS